MSNIVSLLFYLFSFLFAALLMHYGLRRDNKIIIGLGLGIPILIGSMRYGVGTDYLNYVLIYNNLSDFSISQFLTDNTAGIEIGFFLLIKLSKLITDSPFILFAISSFLTILFFYIGLKRYNIKYPALTYLLFLLIIFPMTLNVVRQGIAISICFYALSFMIERKPRAYFSWIFIASLFHITSLFLLPLYFLVKVIKTQKNNFYLSFLLKLTVLALGIYLLLPYVFDLLAAIPSFEKYEKYQTLAAQGNNYTLYLQFVMILSIVALSKWTVLRNNIMNIYFYFLTFAIFELILMTLGFSSAFIKRIALYFSFFSIILLTNTLNIFNDKLGKFLIYSLLIAYGVLYFYLAYYQLGQANVIPYRFMTGEGL
jgi:EpsG-like putative glucosyltransferase